ncbi:RNA-binding protein [Candidatus Woesearchaeota archaeon]|nr:RNA-binding protein [Candidatus Woesearchaeota archaeon]
MSKLLVEERQMVVPGQVLAEGMDYLPGDLVLRDKDVLVSQVVGVVGVNGRLIRITPLVGTYVPKAGDIVIGKVVAVGFSGWRIDIGWAFEANLGLKDASSDFIDKGSDLTKYFAVGDYLLTQIVNVASTKIIDVGMKGPGLRKLSPGRIFNVGAMKVPRIIGKQGSMISLIKEYTGCKVSVGQNGTVWLSGDNVENELLAISAIELIEKESYTSGLTERVKTFLEKNKNG